MSDKVAKARAHLALLEAEESYVQAKASGDVSLEDKLALRELRRDYRENHRSPVKNGAQPAAMSKKVEVK